MPNPVFIDKNLLTLYEFGESTEFIIGRSPSCNVNIAETCISRTQCIVSKVPEGEWLIVDKSSFKSTFLNGATIPCNGMYLKTGDEVSFSNLKAYCLIFYEDVDELPRSCKRRKVDTFHGEVAGDSVEVRLQEMRDPLPPASDLVTESCATAVNETSSLVEENKMLSNSLSKLEDEIKKLKEDKNIADSILSALHLDRQELQKDFEECTSEIHRLVEERAALREELSDSNNRLIASGENSNQGCSSNSTSLTTETENALILRSIEVEELKDELTETKLKLEKAEELVNNLEDYKEKINGDAIAVIEQEFLCCVCSDLLFEPVTLNCRHTLCRDCLREWKKKKKECPSCRAKIKFEVSPLMVDSFIDRIAPILGDEFIKKRKESISERTAPPTPTHAKSAPFTGYSGRGRRGARRNESRLRANHYRNLPAAVYEVIDLTARHFDHGSPNTRMGPW